jgi:high-affinity Fe2+/Pb2+ permease
MEINVAKAQENWASFLTAVIIWILVVYVYWNLINSYVDRNYAEEVKR